MIARQSSALGRSGRYFVNRRDSKRIPKVEKAGYGIMDVGDCFVMLGGFYHAGGLE